MTSLTSPQIDGLAKDLIFSTLIGNLEKVFWGGIVRHVLTWMPRSCVPGQLACQRGRPDTGKLACHRHGGVSDHTVDLTHVRWARSTSLSCWRAPRRKDHERHGEVQRYGTASPWRRSQVEQT
ncbi:hypothetical protein BHE74_00019084 [Ensete ventricosum]|nr:hypothetical protein BHE74_00019084 [Ensete ventricosum]